MDIIEIEILEDGVISVQTGDIKGTNHISADELLDEITSLAGGKRNTERRENTFFKKKKVLRGGKIVATNG